MIAASTVLAPLLPTSRSSPPWVTAMVPCALCSNFWKSCNRLLVAPTDPGRLSGRRRRRPAQAHNLHPRGVEGRVQFPLRCVLCYRHVQLRRIEIVQTGDGLARSDDGAGAFDCQLGNRRRLTEGG